MPDTLWSNYRWYNYLRRKIFELFNKMFSWDTFLLLKFFTCNNRRRRKWIHIPHYNTARLNYLSKWASNKKLLLSISAYINSIGDWDVIKPRTRRDVTKWLSSACCQLLGTANYRRRNIFDRVSSGFSSEFLQNHNHFEGSNVGFMKIIVVF